MRTTRRIRKAGKTMTEENKTSDQAGQADLSQQTKQTEQTGRAGQARPTAGEEAFRSGFIAVVGRPNVGKSTLINAIVGKQVAITSSKPETTRKAIRAIVTTDDCQLVLVDTPGFHKPRTLLGQKLNDIVDESLADVDAVAFLLPADQEIGPGDKRILQRLQQNFSYKNEQGEWVWRKPVVGVLTKIDNLKKAELVNKIIELDQFGHFSQIVLVSALMKDNVDEVVSVFASLVPEGPQLYPTAQISEEPPKETIAELIRGSFLEELDDELPHSLAVVVDSVEYPEDEDEEEREDEKVVVHVSIYVERDSQKPIILGKHACHLVNVKKKLRTPVNRIIGRKSVLDLHVKVAKNWQSDPKKIQRLGFI